MSCDEPARGIQERVGSRGTEAWQVLGVTASPGRLQQAPQCADLILLEGHRMCNPHGAGAEVTARWHLHFATLLFQGEKD